MAFRSFFLALLLLPLPILLLANTAAADKQLAVLPASFQLMYPGAEQQFILERRGLDGNFEGQIVDEVTWTSSDPSIVTVADNRARAVGDGETTIQANWQGKIAETTVKVSGTELDFTWDFRRRGGCGGVVMVWRNDGGRRGGW